RRETPNYGFDCSVVMCSTPPLPLNRPASRVARPSLGPTRRELTTLSVKPPRGLGVLDGALTVLEDRRLQHHRLCMVVITQRGGPNSWERLSHSGMSRDQGL